MRYFQEKQTDLKLYEQEHECLHKNKEIRIRTIRGGSKQYVYQCLSCGRAQGGAISEVNAKELQSQIIDFDSNLKEQWELKYQEGRKNIIGKHDDRENYDRHEFFKNYNLYLNSKEWKEKREKVLTRANRICEGCGNQKAVHVHHLTYKHVSREFLFELVAVCQNCHEKLHNEHQDDFIWRSYSQ